MRKTYKSLLFFIVVSLLLSLSNKTFAQSCEATFNSTFYDQVSQSGLLEHDNAVLKASWEAAVAGCGKNGCAAGSACRINDGWMNTVPPLPWPTKHFPFPAESFSGVCEARSDVCCGSSTNGNSCNAQIPCCDTNLSCFNPHHLEKGDCRICANISNTDCTNDDQCCGSDTQDLVCNLSTHKCVNKPAVPTGTCSAGNIDNGQTCDVWWYAGDNGNCSRCVSGKSENTTECNPSSPSQCTKRCLGLAIGADCGGINCACTSNVCNNGKCADAAACVNAIGAPCSVASPCCTTIRNSPATCGPSNTCITACPPTIAPGTNCSSPAECCTANTGLTCYGGKCTNSGTIGTECFSPGQCLASGCVYGEVCQNGTCVPTEDCENKLTPNPYRGPIVSFNDLVTRIYNVLYPVGIAIGLFFIAKGGYTIMMSEGNPAKISEGKDELTSAVIGTVFILLSLVIFRIIIRALLGANI